MDFYPLHVTQVQIFQNRKTVSMVANRSADIQFAVRKPDEISFFFCRNSKGKKIVFSISMTYILFNQCQTNVRNHNKDNFFVR